MKNLGRLLFFVFMGLLLSAGVYASDDGVAKVIVMKGKIMATDPSGKEFPIKKGTWLKEGTVLNSEAKSFCKLLFIDKSTMNLGPKSQMKIDTFPKEKAGVITLLKGQLRSKVTKDYMNMKDKNKSKLFIKTKSAAMGVRGTDFQVNYNPVNDNTILITFSGAVAMAQITEAMANVSRSVSQNNLEKAVSSDNAVIVKKGEFSGVTKNSQRATVPVKMSPVQLESLKKNESGIKQGPAPGDQAAGPADKAPKKQLRSIVPPGMDAKAVANDNSEAKNVVMGAIGAVAVQAVEREVFLEKAPEPGYGGDPALAGTPGTPGLDAPPPPEGFFNPQTGEYAPPAGSVVDLTTANIVPPPADAMFDSNSGTYILPPTFGNVDVESGSYQAPDGLVMTHDGSFASSAVYDPVAISDSTVVKADGTIDDGRSPASIADGEPPPPGSEPVNPDGTTALAPPPGEPVLNPDGTPMLNSDGTPVLTGDAPPPTGPEVFNPIAPGSEPPPPDAFYDPNLSGGTLSGSTNYNEPAPLPGDEFVEGPPPEDLEQLAEEIIEDNINEFEEEAEAEQFVSGQTNAVFSPTISD